MTDKYKALREAAEAASADYVTFSAPTDLVCTLLAERDALLRVAQPLLECAISTYRSEGHYFEESDIEAAQAAIESATRGSRMNDIELTADQREACYVAAVKVHAAPRNLAYGVACVESGLRLAIGRAEAQAGDAGEAWVNALVDARQKMNEAILAAPQQPEPSAGLSDVVSALKNILVWDDGNLPGDLMDEARAAIAAHEAKRGAK